MKSWRWFILIMVAISISILIAATWLGWNSWDVYKNVSTSMRRQPFYTHASLFPRISPVLSSVSALITLYLIGILILFLFPKHIQTMRKALRVPPLYLLRLFFLGLFSALLVGAIAISAAITMGTFPIAIILGLTLFLCGLIGVIAISYTLGAELFNRAGWGHLSPMYALLLGTVVLYPLGRIPFLGNLLSFALVCLGLGIVFVTHFGTGKSWNLRSLMDE
ncbi:MAG: hypothetical protein J7L73_02930 [Anaerolineales bacterium]|nr:hypothetical protein [Anaerolineales bacterium]